MEFYLDVDGVLLDFEATFMDYVRQRYLPDLPAGFISTSWELNDGPLSKLDVQVAWDSFMASGQFGQLNLLAEVKSFNHLSSSAPVHLVTNLPKEYHQERMENLQAHGLRFASLNMGGHHDFGIPHYPSKAQVINGLYNPEKQLVFLDDHPQNCRGVKTHFPNAQVYLMHRPHNQDLPDEDWQRVQNWTEFAQLFG